MCRGIRDIAASVHQRLLNEARETGRPFNELLQKFAIERFIYRLSISPHANRFILKGALMLPVWSGSASRPTMDIGFGDVIIPRPCRVEYPGLLDFPRAKLKGYTMENTIAEKFHAMVKLDVLNSRMKDFYDIWMLSNTFVFKGERLAEAVEKTFKNRKTPMTVNLTIFEPSFAEDSDKNIQWKGYISKTGLDDAPETFSETIASIKVFLKPVVTALADHQPFLCIWKAPGPWSVL